MSSMSSATRRPVVLRRENRAARWQQRLGGNYSASPVFADGRIYFLSEEGVATVIAPGRFQAPGRQRARWRDTGLDGGGGRGDLHPQPRTFIASAADEPSRSMSRTG